MSRKVYLSRRGAPAIGLLLALAACGGGGDRSSQPIEISAINTLAYVDTECHEAADGYFEHQSLQVRQGEHDPVSVFDVSFGPLPPTGACALFGLLRDGEVEVFGSVFQRFSVSPDGTALVFEVTDDFSLLAPNKLIAPEREGIYFVRADGTGLRRLGDASREASFRPDAYDAPFFSFSPNGRAVVFADFGPDVAGQQTVQIFTLDVADGRRTQITHLPSAPLLFPPFSSTGTPVFLSDTLIAFQSNVNTEGLNLNRDTVEFTVNIDGSGLKVAVSGATILTPNGEVMASFSITGAGRIAAPVGLPGVPVNPPGNITEIFTFDGINALQLTNYRRVDTAFQGVFVSVDQQRVYFSASVDPFGRNPTSTCQLFSVDALGGDLEQVTEFTDPEPSRHGCALGASLQPPLGCITVPNNGYAPSQDARTGTIVFASSCDPFGTNPNGGQLFAIRPDGTGLRQLTNSRGMTTDPDGTVRVELPGPYAYGPYR